MACRHLTTMELLSTSRWNRRYCASSRHRFSAGCRPTGSRCVQLARSGAHSSARGANTLLRLPAHPAEVSSASRTQQKISVCHEGASSLSPNGDPTCCCWCRWNSSCERRQRRPDCPQRARPYGTTSALLPWWRVRSATLTPRI